MADKITLNCPDTLEELTKRWDYMTSESFYAGCDGVMDVVFTGTRKDDRITLIYKAPAMRTTFASVFSGRLVETPTGSAIIGGFRKRYSDYVIGAIICVLLFGFAQGMLDIYYYASIIFATVSLVIICLLLTVTKRSKKRYTDFLERIIRGI
ncbi:MAG TPA: hypothetical protein PLT66_04835 [Bacillota bacterium]|nr:hypothetical protein [Bacillota bacterium]